MSQPGQLGCPHLEHGRVPNGTYVLLARIQPITTTFQEVCSSESKS